MISLQFSPPATHVFPESSGLCTQPYNVLGRLALVFQLLTYAVWLEAGEWSSGSEAKQS